MIEVIFVHGVATRPSSGYDTMVANRDALIKAVLFEGAPATITSPMWGRHASNLAWGGAAFQRGSDDIASLNLGVGGGGGLHAAPAGPANLPGDLTLAAVASASPTAAIDELFAAMVALADEEGRALGNGELEQFRAATRFLAGDGLLTTTTDMADDAFVDALRDEIGIAGSFGLGDRLKEAANRVTGLGRNLAGRGLVALFRDDLNPAVAMFLGDIFAYLKPGPMRNAIRETIVLDLRNACQRAQQQSTKLILIGHSLGGVILYDLLSSPDAAGLPANFRADALITVGSQPGLFEELTLFDHVAEDRGKPHRVAGPASVGKWFNIIDPIDLFAFKSSSIFADAIDLEFDSATGLSSAHTMYFSRPQFHARLRKRLVEHGIITA